MTFRPLSLLLAFALMIGPALAADAPATEPASPPPDAEAARLMRGHWVLTTRAPETTAVTVTLELAVDGQLTLEEEYKTKDDKPARIILKGKWWVKGGIAYGHFTESSPPGPTATDYTTTDVILRLDERFMELRSSDGHFERWQRNVG